MVYPEYGAVPAHIPRFVCGREAALCIAGIGLTFLTFPYGTPETNSRGGVRKGILYVSSASEGSELSGSYRLIRSDRNSDYIRTVRICVMPKHLSRI